MMWTPRSGHSGGAFSWLQRLTKDLRHHPSTTAWKSLSSGSARWLRFFAQRDKTSQKEPSCYLPALPRSSLDYSSAEWWHSASPQSPHGARLALLMALRQCGWARGWPVGSWPSHLCSPLRRSRASLWPSSCGPRNTQAPRFFGVF